MEKLIIMILSFGGLAGLAVLVTNFVGGSLKIQEIMHKLFQKKAQENIIKKEEKEIPIIKKIIESEIIAKETREKINSIKKEANKEIVKILQKDNVEDILIEDNTLWKW